MRDLIFHLLLVFACSLTASRGWGQSTLSEEQLYCTAGLHPDGYIDFSSLPPAPSMQPQPDPSSAVTALLPVVGVPGLTVTVTIPPLSSYGGPPFGPKPVYTVNGGTLNLNGVAHTSSATVLTLAFNQPIEGIGLHTETSGRFAYSYTLQVGPAPIDFYPIFAATAAGYTTEQDQPQTQSLQLVGLNTLFQSASIQFSGDEYQGVTLSNIRIQSAFAPDPASAVPAEGLQQWLRADTVAGFAGEAGFRWLDRSGHGRDATPSSLLPSSTADGRNCQAAFQFSGDQYFSFSLPIAGWTEMTLFLVAKAASDSGSDVNRTAILWLEDAPWGNTFVSPSQTHLYASFGSTQTGNQFYYTRSGGSIGQDFTTTRAVHDHEADSLFVDGLSVQKRENKFPALRGTTGRAMIGKGFDGEISEILVYDRVLSASQAALVENYLEQRYGSH